MRNETASKMKETKVVNILNYHIVFINYYAYLEPFTPQGP
jgi:hypothetical protein